MIRSPLGLRLHPDRPIREQIRQAAAIGAKGVVVDATGDIAPDRLSETGRRELRHLLRSVELALVALHLPTRRPFDTIDQLDDRLRRAERAFALAYELGTTLVLARLGALPPESDAPRREVWLSSLAELGRRADHRGVRLSVETGTEAGEVLRPILDGFGSPGLAASIDPAALLVHDIDPIQTTRDLGPWASHAYAPQAAPAGTVGLGSGRAGGAGFPAGTLDWEEYLGALEEVGYRGFLTAWPDPGSDAATQFAAIAERLQRF